MRDSLHGVDCFLVKRVMKVINNKLDEIMKKKGCDASNMFDEEVPEHEQEFSDDEIEKEVKRNKKLRKRGDLEDGEIPSEYAGKKRIGNKREEIRPNQQRQSQYRTSEIPVYSTSMPVAAQNA